MPFALVAFLSCQKVCVALLGYNEGAPALDASKCRCVDIVSKQEGLPIPITLHFPKPKREQAEPYDDRPALPLYGPTNEAGD